MRDVRTLFRAYWCGVNGLERVSFSYQHLVLSNFFRTKRLRQYEVRLKNIVTTKKMSCMKQPAMYFLPIKESAVNSNVKN